MFQRMRVAAIELERALEAIENLDGYASVFALVRVHGLAVGTVEVPVQGDRCTTAALGKAILAQHRTRVLQRLLQRALRSPLPSGGLELEELFGAGDEEPWARATALITVAVCTRDRPGSLSVCLEALTALDYPTLDLLVVDNAPASDATERLVRARFPKMRYVREDRPGLDWARNRAIQEAHGDIVAFTDDDAAPDPSWIQAIGRVFVENPGVMAVTGIGPALRAGVRGSTGLRAVRGLLEGLSAHMVLGEAGRRRVGFLPRFLPYRRRSIRYRGEHGIPESAVRHAGGLRPGARRRHGHQRRRGSGDVLRVLHEGHALVYEPAAVVWHRHRRERADLEWQIGTWGTALYSYLVRSALVYRECRVAIARFGLWWFWERYCLPLARWTLFMEPKLDVVLLATELRGVFPGLFRYRQAQAQAARIDKAFGPQPFATLGSKSLPSPASPPVPEKEGIRLVDLSQPLQDLTDVADCSSVRIVVSCEERLLGHVTLDNWGQVISADRLQESIAMGIGLRLLKDYRARGARALEADAAAVLRRRYVQEDAQAVSRPAGRLAREIPVSVVVATRDRPESLRALSREIPVSVVVATRDRPESLRRCLRALAAQRTNRHVEIIVVDNHPASARTPPVVAEFPGIQLLSEARQGLSYARNAGIRASRGEIVVTTDDDVVAPTEWLERLVAPLATEEVMVVTGNVLPGELETRAQRLFEMSGGLGRGYERIEADAKWFSSFNRRAVPTWQLGATANAAFRASLFAHPEIGLLDEALGPGMPTGFGADTYLFYKVLKAGYRILYEPDAYVWHLHRREMPALRSQIYNQGKGHVAYHLTTLLQDHDLRALTRLLIELPLEHLRKIHRRVRGWTSYPVSLVGVEAIGHLMGPVALWRARRRVHRAGKSEPYKPVAQPTCTGEGISEPGR